MKIPKDLLEGVWTHNGVSVERIFDGLTINVASWFVTSDGCGCLNVNGRSFMQSSKHSLWRQLLPQLEPPLLCWADYWAMHRAIDQAKHMKDYEPLPALPPVLLDLP